MTGKGQSLSPLVADVCNLLDTAKDLSLDAWFLLHLHFASMDPSAPSLLLKHSLCLVTRGTEHSWCRAKMYVEGTGWAGSSGCLGEVRGASGRPSRTQETRRLYAPNVLS